MVWSLAVWGIGEDGMAVGHVAISVRTVGVALFPPLFVMLVSSSQFKSLLKRLSYTLGGPLLWSALFVGVGTTFLGFANTSILWDFVGVARKPKISTLVLEMLSYRLTELGELLGNLPMTKLPARLHFAVPWFGLLLLLLTTLAWGRNEGKFVRPKCIWFPYMGILFAWPYYDARFWLPVIPLLVAYSLLGVRRL